MTAGAIMTGKRSGGVQKPRRYVEDPIQAAIVAYLRTVAPDCITASIPNGGLRTKREAARLKWTGALAGMPDLIMITPRMVIFFEIKAPKKGRISDDQDAVHERLRGMGYVVAILRSVEDARLALASLNIKTREAA